MKNKKHTRTFYHSFRDAFRGVWCCVRSERNMRFHLAAGCFVVYTAARLRFTATEWAVLALTIGAMLQAETMNTSVERLCDFVKPQPDPQIRDVKDLAAGAVVITALAAVAVGACLFLRRDAWLLFVQIITTPGHCATLVLAFLAAAAFVVLPGKRKENTGK